MSAAYRFWSNVDKVCKGTSLVELSAGIGVSYQTIMNQRSRDTLPSLKVALSMASYLHVSVEEMAYGPDHNVSPYSARVRRIAEACMAASSLDLSMVERILGLPEAEDLTGEDTTLPRNA